MHALHEVAVFEVPVLEDDRPPRAFQDVRDSLRDLRVGTGAADEKFRRRPASSASPSTFALPLCIRIYCDYRIGRCACRGRTVIPCSPSAPSDGASFRTLSSRIAES